MIALFPILIIGEATLATGWQPATRATAWQPARRIWSRDLGYHTLPAAQ